MSSDFGSSFSYGTYDFNTGFNSIGGSGYAGQNITYQGTTATGFDAFTSNPYLTTTTTTGFTQDQSIVGTANYQIGVDFTNNAVSGFANPNTGGAQSLTLDNTYYNIQTGSDAYLTTQFNTAGSIAEIQTLTATVIANTQGVDDTYIISDIVDNTILTSAADGQSLNVPLSVSQLNVQIITAESTTVADSSVSASAATTVTALTPVAVSAGAVSTFDANTLFEQAVVYNTTVTLTNAEVLEILQENIDAAVSLRSEVLADSEIDPNTFTIRDGDINSSTYGRIVTTTAAVEAVIDAAYATYDAFKDNPQAFVELIRNPALDALGEVLVDTEAGVRVVDIGDFTPIDGQVNSTTVDTTGQTVSQSSIATASQTFISNQNLSTTLTGDSISAADQAAFDLQLIRIQEVNQEVQGDPIIRQILADVQGTFGTEAELRVAAAAELAEYFGIDSPLGLAALDRALKTITAQIPGVSEIRTVAGAAGQGVKITDILTQTNIDLQNIYDVARAIVLVVNPALRIPLAVVEGLVGLATDTTQSAITTVTNSITTLTGGGGGAEGELPGDLTAYNVSDTGNSQSFQATATAADATVAENLALEEARTQAFDRFGDTTTGFTGLDQVKVRINDNGTYTATYSISAQSFQGPAAVTNSDATAAGINAVIAEQNTDGIIPNAGPNAVQNIYQYPVGPNGETPYDDDGNLNPGWTLDENNNPVYVNVDFFDPTTVASAAASRQAATLASARSQAAQQAQRKQANDGDWRVKLRLAPGAEYLYKDPGLNNNGILWPLNVTDGVIFPYMPVINTSYHANYSNYDLTHSNYRGYFYQNSYVGEVNMTAVFTAQDTKEAEYMLAVIHFFRSATKMFYGQDAPGRGSPPPLVYLQGLGEYQFNLHPCLISQFTYNLPNDVDYIRARSPNLVGTNLQIKRDRKTNPTNPFSAAIERLNAIGQPKGGINIPPAPPTLGTNSPTYVPTKIEIQLTLLPTQTRQQVSQEFSLQKFANGNLLKGGFW